MNTRFSHSIFNQGTGLVHALAPSVGHLYYGPLKVFAPTTHVLALPFGGWFDPLIQHVQSLKVLEHKLESIDLEGVVHELLAMGHSQGCPRSVGQVFRKGSFQPSTLVCFGGPFRGSPVANRVRFLRRIPKRLRGPIEGVVQMMPGSEYEAHLEAKILAALEIPGFVPPDVYLIAAMHDDLVPVESAHYWPEAYPADKVHRVLVAHGLDVAPQGVTLVSTRYGWDNHYFMVRDPRVIGYLQEEFAGTSLDPQIAA